MIKVSPSFSVIKQISELNKQIFFRHLSKKMFQNSDHKLNESSVFTECAKLIPNLSDGLHKGSCGRVGVFGGSIEFTGAPYFASISALKTGADLVYVFTASSAATVIKSYSPELMVMPFLDSEEAVELISPWLRRLHVVLIGPGLGRKQTTFDSIKQVLERLKVERDEDNHIRPLVFDADGLYFVMKNLEFVREYPGPIYLTPNRVEFSNLSKAVLGSVDPENIHDQLRIISQNLGPKVTIVMKHSVDEICSDGQLLVCTTEGSNRRCGGQGDLLSGILSTFAAWAAQRENNELNQINTVYNDRVLASYCACSITRTASKLAFQKLSRSMLASDMIPEIHNAFQMLFRC